VAVFKAFFANPGDFIFIMGPGPGTHHTWTILQMTDILKENKVSKMGKKVSIHSFMRGLIIFFKNKSQSCNFEGLKQPAPTAAKLCTTTVVVRSIDQHWCLIYRLPTVAIFVGRSINSGA
jgi:hypothetical protein